MMLQRLNARMGHPDPVAVGTGGTRSGRELHRAAQAVRDRLRGLLAERGRDARSSQLLLQCEDRYHFAVALLGAWRAGLSVALPASRAGEDNRALSGMEDVLACALDHAPWGDAGAPLIDIRALDAESVQAADAHEVAAAPLQPELGRVAATLYTSGSTGQARGIAKRFDQLLGEAAVQVREFGLGERTVLSTVPGHHIYGLLWSVLVPLLGGGRMVRQTPALPQEVARAARDVRADLLVSVPAHLSAIAASAPLPQSLRRIFSSGAPLLPELARALEQAHGVSVVEILGSTETGGIAQRPTARSPIWQPLPGVSLRADGDGRLWVRSPFADGGVAAESPCQDRVRLLDGGGFEHLGRADAIVKVGARRVDLGALRVRLCELPGVRDAHVLALPVSGIRGNDIACILEAPAGTAYDRRSVRAALRRWFDPSVLPRVVRVVEQVPRATSGKVSREDLLSLLSPVKAPEGAASPAADGIFEFSTARLQQALQGRALSIDAVVRSDAWCFDGHFAGDPILPAIVQLQEFAVAIARRHFAGLGGLRGTRQLKFKAKVRPGDALTLRLQEEALSSDLPGARRVRFRITRGDELCASGSLLFDEAGQAGHLQREAP